MIWGFLNLTEDISDDSSGSWSYQIALDTILDKYGSGVTDEKKSEYVIYWEEFMWDTSWDSNTVSKTENYFSVSEFNQQYDQSYEDTDVDSLTVKTGSSQVWLPQNTISTTLWESTNSSSFYDETCSWIIFDPCLKIWNLDTNDWDFKLLASGTPIYTEVENVPYN